MKIFVCYDGSDIAKRALKNATELFSGFKVVFVIASVVKLDSGLDAHAAESDEELKEEKKAELLKVAKELNEETGFSVDALFSVGNPPRILCDLIKEHGPDCVVTGKRGKESIGERFLGSVSEYIIDNCDKPVIIIH